MRGLGPNTLAHALARGNPARQPNSRPLRPLLWKSRQAPCATPQHHPQTPTWPQCTPRAPPSPPTRQASNPEAAATARPEADFARPESPRVMEPQLAASRGAPRPRSAASAFADLEAAAKKYVFFWNGFRFPHSAAAAPACFPGSYYQKQE